MSGSRSHGVVQARVEVDEARRDVGGDGQLRHDVRAGATRRGRGARAARWSRWRTSRRRASSTGCRGRGSRTREYLDVVDALPKGINTGGYVGDVALRDLRDRRRRVRSGPARHRRRARGDGPRGGGCARGGRARATRSRARSPTACPTVGGSRARGRTRASSSRSPSRSAGSVGASSSARPASTRPTASTPRVDEEMAWIGELSRTLGRPFTFNLTQMRSLGDHYRAGARARHRREPRPARASGPRPRRAASACCSAWRPTRRSTTSRASPPVRDLRPGRTAGRGRATPSRGPR